MKVFFKLSRYWGELLPVFATVFKKMPSSRIKLGNADHTVPCTHMHVTYSLSPLLFLEQGTDSL